MKVAVTERSQRGRVTASICGYTFLELMVVITIVGIFLSFSIPRIAPDVPSEDFRETVNWFALNIPRLKRLAVSEQKTVLLNIDRSDGLLWVSDASSPEAAPTGARKTRLTVPDTVRIREITSFGRSFPESGPVAIHFSPEGVSDYMKIKLSGDDGREADIQIEPFLYAARISHNPQ